MLEILKYTYNLDKFNFQLTNNFNTGRPTKQKIDSACIVILFHTKDDGNVLGWIYIVVD